MNFDRRGSRARRVDVETLLEGRVRARSKGDLAGGAGRGDQQFSVLIFTGILCAWGFDERTGTCAAGWLFEVLAKLERCKIGGRVEGEEGESVIRTELEQVIDVTFQVGVIHDIIAIQYERGDEERIGGLGP